MKSLALLLIIGVQCHAQTWICTKQFKPYYVPGDYEVYVIKQPGMQDPNIVHDTIYVDSCRLKMEAEAKMFDSLKAIHDSNMITDSTGIISAGHYRTGGVQADGWISDPKFFIGTPAKTIYRRGKNGKIIYRERWHRAPKQKVVKKRIPPAKPKEIMLEVSYFWKRKVVKVAYKKEYDMTIDSYNVDNANVHINNFTSVNGKKMPIDSMHFRVFIPE